MTPVPELDRSRDRLLSLCAPEVLAALNDGVLIADLQGNILSMNPAALQLHGFSTPAEAQRPLREFQEEFLLLHADGSPLAANEWPLCRVLRGEVLFSFEAEVRRLDSAHSMLASYSGNLVLSPEGKPEAAILTIRNITDSKRSERDLQSSEVERLLAFEAANMGAWRRNFRTEEVFLSPRACEQFGLPPGKPLYTDDIYGAIVEADRERTRAAVEEAVRNHSDYEAEYRVSDAAGERWLSVKGRASYDAQGQPSLLQGVALDVTEKRKAKEEFLAVERQFHHSQKLDSLGVLAGGVAHDFNNLLTGILGNTSLVLDSLDPLDPNRAMLEEVLRAGERAADLTKQLLAYAGKGRFVTRLIDLSELVREMHRLIRTSIPQKVHVAHHLRKALPAIEGDPSQVQQIVMNLILNAAEATNPADAGTVLVETRALELQPPAFSEYYYNAEALTAGKYVSLEVHDTGSGMDDATKSRIFDPFFTTKFTGRGLGLSAVLGIVRGHRGALRVQSEPGAGTSFTLLFPAAARQPQVETQHEEGGGETVLAVGHCHKELRRLQALGYAVLFCDDFRHAEAILKEGREPAAVVICSDDDAQMDYPAAVHKYRPGVHVILSSQLSPAEQIRKYPGHRFSAFILNDSRAEELDRAIRQVLSLK